MVMQHNGIRYAFCIECAKGLVVPNRIDALEDAVCWECRERCTDRERERCRTYEHLNKLLDKAQIMDSLLDERHDPPSFFGG